VAAAGVVVCALFAVGVGVAVLGQPEAFRRMGEYFATHPVMIGVLIISIAVAVAFIASARPSPAPTESHRVPEQQHGART